MMITKISNRIKDLQSRIQENQNQLRNDTFLEYLCKGKWLVSGILALGLTGCATVVDQYGQTRQVLTPTGSAIAQALVSTGVGAGAGAIFKNQPGWANGMIAGLAGNVASQIVNSMSPHYGDQFVPNTTRQIATYNPPTTQMRMGSRANQYRNSYANAQAGLDEEVAYRRLPNGQFVPIDSEYY